MLWCFALLLQRTSTCCLQTGSLEKRQKAWWGNKWSTLPTREWRERAWLSTRSQPSPQCTTSNMTMTFIFMSMIWSKPPRHDGHLYLSLQPVFQLLLSCSSLSYYSKPCWGWRGADMFHSLSQCNIHFYICQNSSTSTLVFIMFWVLLGRGDSLIVKVNPWTAYGCAAQVFLHLHGCHWSVC